MAFDRHIEADNIEDGFITSIVRAPVVGLAWVLGGLLQDEDKENKEELKPEKENKQSEQLESPTMNSIQEELESNDSSKRHIHIPPHRDGIGIGIVGNRSDDNESFTSGNQSPSSTGEETTPPHANYLQRKKTRKMSWSDESGQDLVVYYGGESNSTSNKTSSGNASRSSTSSANPPYAYPSKHPEKNRRPMKSAIRNSRALPTPHQRQSNKHNCIPSMGGSIVINGAGTVVGAVGKKGAGVGAGANNSQTNSHTNAKNNANGYISPQWGWYISTTPPTPEYHKTSSTALAANKGQQVLSHHLNNTSTNPLQHPHHPHQANSAIGRHWNPKTGTIMEGAGAAPRPVFRKANPHRGGWPSVPI